jgi:hypothetical protein
MSTTVPTNGLHSFGEGVAAPVLRRTIPFDYAFRYELQGEPGLVQNSTVTISIEAAFTAVSIGYGVIPGVSPIKFPLQPPSTVGVIQSPLTLTATGPQFAAATLGDVVTALAQTLGEDVDLSSGASLSRRRIGPLTAVVLRNGFRLNPDFAEQVLLTSGLGPLSDEVAGQVFEAVAAPPDQIVFKYALFDEGSGREFQSEPILNIAGLGGSDGRRPFRYFARPIEFAPRSTVRMQITEVSRFQGDLYISLQGYKTLGAPGSPTGIRPQRIRRHSL